MVVDIKRRKGTTAAGTSSGSTPSATSNQTKMIRFAFRLGTFGIIALLGVNIIPQTLRDPAAYVANLNGPGTGAAQVRKRKAPEERLEYSARTASPTSERPKEEVQNRTKTSDTQQKSKATSLGSTPVVKSTKAPTGKPVAAPTPIPAPTVAPTKVRISVTALEKMTGKAAEEVAKLEAAASKRTRIRDLDPPRVLPFHPEILGATTGGCQGETLHFVWAYDSTLEEPDLSIYPKVPKHLWCGNSDCMMLEAPCLTVERIVLPEVTEGTPLGVWMTQHSINKLLSGNLFEDQLQVAAQLSILYKYGGTVVQPGVSLPMDTNEDMWIGTSVSEGCGKDALPNEMGGLLAMKSPKKSQFVHSQMKSFVDAYYGATTSPVDGNWKSIFSRIDCTTFKDSFKMVNIVSPLVFKPRNARYALLEQGLSSLPYLPLVDNVMESIRQEVTEPTVVVVNGEHPLSNIPDKLRPLFIGLAWNNRTDFDEEYMSEQWPIGVDGGETLNNLGEHDIESFVTYDLTKTLPCVEPKIPSLEESDPMKEIVLKYSESVSASCKASKATTAQRRLMGTLNETDIPGWDVDRHRYKESESGIRNRLNVLMYCQPPFGDAARKFGVMGPEWKYLEEHYAPCPEPETDPSIPRVAMVVDFNLMQKEIIFATFLNSLANNHKTPIIMYILTTNLDDAQRCMVRYMVGQPLAEGSRVYVISVDHEIQRFMNYQGLSHISLATQARLLLPQLLPCVPKILWLDCDTIVMRNLADMWAVQTGSACGIAGRPSYSHYVFYQIKGPPQYVKDIREMYKAKNFSMPSFNAGIIVMDLENLRHNRHYNETVEKVAIEYGNDDQVTLNLVCENGTFTKLPEEWNMFHHTGAQGDMKDPAFDKPLEEWGVIHWTSSKKPWAKKSLGLFKGPKLQLLWSMYKRNFSEAIACEPEQDCVMKSEDNDALRSIVKGQTPFPTAAPSSAPPTPAPKRMEASTDKTCNYLPFGGELITVWAYDSIPGYYDTTFGLYHSLWKRVVCRKDDCVKRVMALNVPCLRVQKWKVKDLAKGTALEKWYAKNEKIASDGHLQVAMQLLYVYKFGGIVTKPGIRLPSPLPFEWIGAKEVVQGERVDSDGHKCEQLVVAETAFQPPGGIVGVGAQQKSEFINSMLNIFVDLYKRERRVKMDWTEYFDAIDCSKWVQLAL